MSVPGKPRQSATRALLSGMIGIIIFLAVLIIFRYIADHSSSAFFSGFVDLLFAYVPLIILFSLLFMFADIFATFPFPFNLPFPLFSAFGSVLLVSFLLLIIEFITTFHALGISPAIQIIRLILYPLTFIVVLVTGYISIFQKCPEKTPDKPAPGQGSGTTEKPATPSWEDVAGEFRQMLSDLFRRMREEFNRK